jgi:hypothetical protein
MVIQQPVERTAAAQGDALAAGGVVFLDHAAGDFVMTIYYLLQVLKFQP